MESSTKTVKVPLYTVVVDNNTIINELNRISLEMNDLFYYMSSILRIYLLYNKLENNEEIPLFSHQLIITASQICKISNRNVIQSDCTITRMK